MSKLDFQDWVDKYKPKAHPGESCHGMAIDINGKDTAIMLDTHGDDWEHVRLIDPKYVWTVVGDDADTDYDDIWHIVSGFCIVNRLGYIVTEIQHNFERDLEIEY